jgi:hypothetical protein
MAVGAVIAVLAALAALLVRRGENTTEGAHAGV